MFTEFSQPAAQYGVKIIISNVTVKYFVEMLQKRSNETEAQKPAERVQRYANLIANRGNRFLCLLCSQQTGKLRTLLERGIL